MKLHFEITKEQKKAMIKAIEDRLGVKAKYLGVPTCAYEIGDYKVEKDGSLCYPDYTDESDIDESADIVSDCVKATGVEPDEWEGCEEDMIEEFAEEQTVTVPAGMVTNRENLERIVESKGNLIKKALGVDDLPIEFTERSVTFHWFRGDEAMSALTYSKFIQAICKLASSQKKITAKERVVENEKYAFRCFLLRLGFIGDEYKEDRKVLLKNLEGSSAFRDGRKA